MITVSIGNAAACVLCLDGGAAEELGFTILATTARTTTLHLTDVQARSLLAELEDRASAQWGGWDLEPAERQACRRAAHAISRQLVTKNGQA